MDKNKIDLNAPAFGNGAQKVEDLAVQSEGEMQEQTQTEPEKEQTIETSEEESKVPYSRFKKFHDAAKEAQAEAEYWRKKAVELEGQPERISYDEDLPKEWVELYGDSEKSKAAWRVQQEMFRRAEDRAEQRAREAFERQRFEEEQRTEENLETIDSNFDDLFDNIGRALTEKEQVDLLDAVDFLTPKDRNGNYAGPLVPFEAAWDYVQAKQGATKSARSQSRNQVASISASQSHGEPTITEKQERDKNWNPFGGWDSYKNRL